MTTIHLSVLKARQTANRRMLWTNEGNPCFLFLSGDRIIENDPGLKDSAVMRIVAEMGINMKAFLTFSVIVEWAESKPRNAESTGKIRGRKRLHGNKYLRVILIQCTWVVCRTKESIFFYKYYPFIPFLIIGSINQTKH